jgi:hypothetical protein
MKSIKEIANEHLTWFQPKAIHQFYELRSETDLFGTVNFPKSFGSFAEAESTEGKWTFKRIGFFQIKITIRKAGSEKDLAVFKPKWTGYAGSIEFADGKVYHWQSSNFFATKFDLHDSSGKVLFSFRHGVDDQKLTDWFKTQARVEVNETAKNLPETGMLILFCWYLIVVLQMESSAGAVASAAG